MCGQVSAGATSHTGSSSSAATERHADLALPTAHFAALCLLQSVRGSAAHRLSGGCILLSQSFVCAPSGIFAHYEDLLLTELGLLAPRFALSMGASPDASWLAALPTLGPAPAAVVGAAQGVTLFVGAALGLALAGKIGAVEVQHGRARVEEVGRVVLSQRLLTLLMAAELWHIIL